MIASDLNLTNYHCGVTQLTPATCRATTIDLGWEKGGVRWQFVCAGVEAESVDLDFAILRLSPLLGPTGARGGSLAARLSEAEPQVDEELYMIHHADCAYKRISSSYCSVRAVRTSWTDTTGRGPLTEFAHDCDTERGSSGAPVFDVNGTVVGLHHLGYEDCGGTADRLNKAVSAVQIRDTVAATYPKLAAELGWN